MIKKLFLLLFLTSFLNVICQERNTENIKSIRDNFNRINAKKDWKKVDSLDLLEGDSQSVFYYSNKGLEKLVHTNFGEYGKKIVEYYVLNNNISFVSERELKYNSNATLKEFDSKKTTLEQTKYYFQNDTLFDIVSNQDCGSRFADDFVTAENKRIHEDFDRILKLKNNTN